MILFAPIFILVAGVVSTMVFEAIHSSFDTPTDLTRGLVKLCSSTKEGGAA